MMPSEELAMKQGKISVQLSVFSHTQFVIPKESHLFCHSELVSESLIFEKDRVL
jgi:hypothetical protein